MGPTEMKEIKEMAGAAPLLPHGKISVISVISVGHKKLLRRFLRSIVGLALMQEAPTEDIRF